MTQLLIDWSVPHDAVDRVKSPKRQTPLPKILRLKSYYCSILGLVISNSRTESLPRGWQQRIQEGLHLFRGWTSSLPASGYERLQQNLQSVRSVRRKQQTHRLHGQNTSAAIHNRGHLCSNNLHPNLCRTCSSQLSLLQAGIASHEIFLNVMDCVQLL